MHLRLTVNSSSLTKSILSLFLLGPLGLGGTLAWAGECDALLVAEAQEHVRCAQFCQNRELKVYEKHIFGHSFGAFLEQLTAQDTWIDVGSGNGFAVADYVLRTQGTHAKAVGVTYDMFSTPQVGDVLKAHPDRLRFLTGRFVEDIPNEELGRPMLITDLYGALSYTADFQTVLQKYLDLLHPDGVMFLYIEPGRTNRFWDCENLISLHHFFKTIPGIELTVLEKNEAAISIRKTLEKVVVPNLKLREFVRGSPPQRVYEIQRDSKP